MTQFTRAIVAAALLTFVLLSSVPTATNASLAAIDLGTEWIKVAAPKNNNIDIVLNEQSNRKSQNYIGFRSDERYFADDAKNFAARFPDNMFTVINRLVGVSSTDKDVLQKWLRDEMQLTFKIEPYAGTPENVTRFPDDPKADTVQYRTGSNPDVAYSAEVLQAMMFGFLVDMARKDAKMKAPIRDIVVTIPAFLSQRQRLGLLNAAKIADLNVIALVHSTTATAFQAGLIPHGFGEETKNVLIYDMGATKTDVGIYTFSPPVAPAPGKKQKKSEKLGVMTTRAIVSNSNLGGRTFDVCIAKLLEDRWVEETKQPRVLNGETLQQRKATVSLLRAANKAKEMLSANRKAPVTVEGMAQDRDFNTFLTREEFEERCAPQFKQAVDMVNQALAATALSGEEIKLADIHKFEMFGGGARVPKIVSDLSDFRGVTVDRTLNSDETAAVGAGFYAGAVAGRFNIEAFSVKETLFPTATSVSFTLSALEGKKSVNRPLFDVGALKGTRKSVTVPRSSDFSLNVFLNREGEEPVLDYVVGVEGIDSALNSVPIFEPETSENPGKKVLSHPNNTFAVRLEFRAQESGVATVEAAEVRVTYVINVTKSKRVNLTEEELTEAQEKARVEADKLANEHEDTLEQEEVEAKKNMTEAEVAAMETEDIIAQKAAARKARVEDKIAKAVAAVKTYRTERTLVEESRRKVIDLKTNVTFAAPHPLNRDDIRVGKSILRELEAIDREKRETAQAKNDLEAMLLSYKTDGLLDSEIVKEHKLMTPEAEEEIKAALEKVSDWLDDEGSYDGVKKAEFLEKRDQIKIVTQNITDQIEKIKNPPKAKGSSSKKDKKGGKKSSSKKKKAGKKADKEEEEEPTANAGDEEKPPQDDASKDDQGKNDAKGDDEYEL